MLRNFLLRLIINAATLAATAAILPGIHIADNAISTLAFVALIFGLVNALFKPLITILSCPLILFTLGLWLLVINGIILLITDALAGDRFEVDGFWWAVLGGLVAGLIAALLENVLGLNDDDKNDDDKPLVIFSQ